MIHILVLEDDRDLNDAVCRHLETRGYSVTGCTGADDAFFVMESRRCDLVISDIMLPGRSGFDFAKDLRQIDPDIPILFMTAYDDMEFMRRGYQLGIDDYLSLIHI